MKKMLAWRPPDEMREQIKAIAQKRGLTVNSLLIQVLWDWLKQHEREEPK